MSLGLEIPNESHIYPVLELGRYFTDDISEGLNIVNIGVNYYLE